MTEIIKDKECRIEDPEKEFFAEKNKTAELDKCISEITDKSLAIEDMSESSMHFLPFWRKPQIQMSARKTEICSQASSKHIA